MTQIISENFIRIYVSCYLFAVSIAFFLSSYSNYQLTEAISYSTNDGWCNPSTQGIGDHCFGDFYYPLSLAVNDAPWSGSPNPYPPFALVIYKPFGFLLEFLDARAVLSLYLGILIASLIATIVIIIKQNRFKNMEFTLVLLSTLGSAPIMSVIDRGNSAILLFPIIYFWIISVRSNNLNQIVILSCLAATLRPQFISLCLILLFLGKVEIFVRSFFISLASICLSFLMFGINPINNFINWVYQIISYQDYAAIGSIFPVNVSFANSMNLLLRVINVQNSEVIIKFLTYFLFVLFVWVYWRNRARLPLSLKINSALITPIFFVGTAFHYYLFILGLIFINYLIERNARVDELEVESQFNRIYQLVARLLFLSILVPWALPWSIFPGLDASRGWPVIGIQWVIGQGTFMVFALLTFYVYPIINVRMRK